MKSPSEYRLAILEKLKGIVCRDRMKDYSDAEDNFRHIGQRWTLYLNQRFGASFKLESHDVAVMMCDVKISRIAATPTHQDSWYDLAGYAVCGGGIIDKAAGVESRDFQIQRVESPNVSFTAGELHNEAIAVAQQRVSRGTIIE